MKEPRMQGENQVMMKDHLKRETRQETYGTLRRNMMRDGLLIKTSDGKMKRTAGITSWVEIMLKGKKRSKTVQ